MSSSREAQRIRELADIYTYQQLLKSEQRWTDSLAVTFSLLCFILLVSVFQQTTLDKAFVHVIYVLGAVAAWWMDRQANRIMIAAGISPGRAVSLVVQIQLGIGGLLLIMDAVLLILHR